MYCKTIIAVSYTHLDVYKRQDKKKDNTQNLYAIEGKSSVTVDQMVKYYKKSGCTYPSAALKKGGAADIKAFSKIVLEEADVYKRQIIFFSCKILQFQITADFIHI